MMIPYVCLECGRLVQTVNRFGLCDRCRRRKSDGYMDRFLDWLAAFPRPAGGAR